MPVSDYNHISDVLHVVAQFNPKSVLDVGVGFGKWGVLCREVIDVYQGRLSSSEWQTKIDGVEIFEAYRNSVWSLAYDQVLIGNIFDLIDEMPKYDLTLLCDVIEHFEKKEGLLLLEKLLAHSKIVVLTSPRGYHVQGAAWGNDHERHLSGWSQNDFSNFCHVYKEIGFTFMAVLSENSNYIDGLEVRKPLDVLGFKKGAIELARLAVRRVKYRFHL
jgi:hypothetical protein